MTKKLPSIFLIGPSGAGKSTIGQELAALLKMDFYDSDQVIEQKAGVNISWIFDVEGEDGFRKREMKTIQELAELPNIILATGGGAILTPENRAVLASKGLIIYLKASVEQQLERIHRTDHRPLLKVINREETLKEMKDIREPLYEEIADITFSTESHSVKAISREIHDYLRTKGY